MTERIRRVFTGVSQSRQGATADAVRAEVTVLCDAGVGSPRWLATP